MRSTALLWPRENATGRGWASGDDTGSFGEKLESAAIQLDTETRPFGRAQLPVFENELVVRQLLPETRLT
jgi:hypothetical protein